MAGWPQKPQIKRIVDVILPRLIPYMQKNRGKHICCYNAAYIFVELCCALAVLSLVLCAWPACEPAFFLESLLSPLFQPEGIVGVVSLVGLSGAAFAWLISRTEDRICGVRMSVLVEWVYPNFFSLYFVLFIGLAIFALFMGTARMFWPAFYAFWGALASFMLLCRGCYLFVVRADLRESRAFEYYGACLAHGGDGGVSIRETLLNTADYTRLLLTKERRDATAKTAQLWLKAFPDNQNLPSVEQIADCVETEDNLIRRSDLFCSAWAALLPKGIAEPQDVALVRSMLEHLDQYSWDNGQKKNIFCRQAILLGLSQFLLEIGRKCDFWKATQICALITGMREGADAARELACAWLAMLCVEWAGDAPQAGSALSEAAGFLLPVVEQYLIQGGKEDKDLNGFLFHAHWIARRAKQVKPSAYLLEMSRLLERAGNGIFVDCMAPADQSNLLLILLCYAIWEDEKEDVS